MSKSNISLEEIDELVTVIRDVEFTINNLDEILSSYCQMDYSWKHDFYIMEFELKKIKEILYSKLDD